LAERLKALVLKTSVEKSTVGSNPSPSAAVPGPVLSERAFYLLGMSEKYFLAVFHPLHGGGTLQLILSVLVRLSKMLLFG
jgi:hypothetical protein